MRHELRTAVCMIALAGLAAGCDEKGTMTLRTELQTPEETRQAAVNIPVEDSQQQSIAYSYHYTFELPERQTLTLFERHRRLCEEAGPNQCIMEAAITSNAPAIISRASLHLRAAPQWLAEFRARLSKDAAAADGRISEFRMESDDLSRSIIDTEAHLRAQTTLRDRLQDLLTTRTAKVGELLEIERELARVQGELDSAHSRLAHMRKRVAMSEVVLVYEPDGRESRHLSKGIGGYFATLWQEARDSFLGMMRFLAFILPWLLPTSLLVWALRRLWAARKKAKLEAKAAETTAN